MSYKFSNNGYCPICESETTFVAYNEWFRDYYICVKCNSIPRERALIFCMERYYPNWRDLEIHESSPSSSGASVKLKQCKYYSASHYFPDFAFGETHPSGFRNENIECLSFPDESFDLFISQDVMEHIFNPAAAFLEISRVLKPGGAHIFSVPLVNKHMPSVVRAKHNDNNSIIYLYEPEYHGNPISNDGSLVTMHWGYDICDYIYKNCGLYTTINYIDDISKGIRAEYIEILCTKK